MFNIQRATSRSEPGVLHLFWLFYAAHIHSRDVSKEKSIRGLTLSSEGIVIGPPLTQLRGILTGVPVDAQIIEPTKSMSPRNGRAR